MKACKSQTNFKNKVIKLENAAPLGNKKAATFPSDVGSSDFKGGGVKFFYGSVGGQSFFCLKIFGVKFGGLGHHGGSIPRTFLTP